MAVIKENKPATSTIFDFETKKKSNFTFPQIYNIRKMGMYGKVRENAK